MSTWYTNEPFPEGLIVNEYRLVSITEEEFEEDPTMYYIYDDTTHKYIRILIYKYIDIQIFYYKKEINKVSVPKVRTSEKEKMF